MCKELSSRENMERMGSVTHTCSALSSHGPHPLAGQLLPAACRSKMLTQKPFRNRDPNQVYDIMVMAYLKNSTQSSRKELCLWAHPGFPQEISIRLQGEKNCTREKKKLLISFDMGKMLKVDPHGSQALHILLGTERGWRHAVDINTYLEIWK